MSSQIARRVATLESLRKTTRTATQQELGQAMVEYAARCGLTEAEVIEKFGGWPEFAYACMRGDVVDPTAPARKTELPVGATSMAAYLAMLDKR